MTQIRKNPLVNGNYYHILNRSIAQFQIFNEVDDFNRFMQIIDLYRFKDFSYKFSEFISLSLENQKLISNNIRKNNLKVIKIIAYCIMPTHFHLILEQETKNGITKYMSRILNSYTRYFNLKHHRKGPLWEGHFKNVSIDDDEQMLHLTRYIHLNPVSADLIKKPEDWLFSSYNEYLNKGSDKLCEYDNSPEITPKNYKNFVSDHIAYQKELSKIKKILIDNYSG